MFKLISSHLLLVIFAFGSASAFQDKNFYLAVPLLIATIFQLLKYHSPFKKLETGAILGEIERRSNFSMEITYYFDEILGHPIFEHIFSHLSKTEKFSQMGFDAWKAILIESFKVKFATTYPEQTVKFNVKGGALYVNGKLEFTDFILIQERIFYDPARAHDRIPTFDESLKHAIGLRILVVNGSLKLQIGDFSKEWTPKIYKDSGMLATYRRFETVTEFPLLQIGWKYGLPSRYLNLSFRASNFYRDRFLLHLEKKEADRDWHEINEQVRNYDFLIRSEQAESDRGKCEQLASRFNQKAREGLQREGYSNPMEGINDGYWPWEDGSITLKNKYLSIDLLNINNIRENYENLLSPDYWEERP